MSSPSGSPPRAGNVYELPPGPERGGDRKYRRHVLLTSPREIGDGGTFVYASTQATEADAYGAPALPLDIPPEFRHYSGFTRSPVYLYATRLVLRTTAGLGERLGTVARFTAKLGDALRAGWGIGEGTWQTWRAPRGGAAGPGGSGRMSVRGKVAEFSEPVRARLLARYGVIITAHAHSANRHDQVIVPLFSAEFEARPGDVALHGADWTTTLDGDYGAGVLAASLLLSLSERDSYEGRDDKGRDRPEIVTVLDLTIPDDTLRAVEAEIERRYRVAPSPPRPSPSKAPKARARGPR